MKFYIVDAFTDVLFGGNPAGVVLLDEGGAFPEDEQMRKTAAELRYSETAFVKKLTDGSFEVRYFTPAAEVDLCGHATIGTFAALLAEGGISDLASYVCRTKAGLLDIQVEQGFIMMDMATPRWIDEITAKEALEELYTVMGFSAREVQEMVSSQGKMIDDRSSQDLVFKNKNIQTAMLPVPALISTGLPDIIMPVPSKEILDSLKPDFSLLTALSKKYEVVGVHAFALGDDQITAYCRNFAPLYEIDEEAATGTSNGALTYFLYRHGIIKESVMNRIIQGEAMNRPSQICSRLSTSSERLSPNGEDSTSPSSVKIQVGGRAVVLASGTIYL